MVTVDQENIVFPDVSLPYFVNLLHSLGFVSAGFSGAQQIQWQEIRAWQEATGTELTLWEAETLHRLSGAYAAMLHKARDPNCPIPYFEETDEQRAARQAAIDDYFFKPTGFKQAKENKRRG